MIFGQDRNQIRQLFFSAWQKYRTGQPTEPLEQLIGEIIAQHPEYHRELENPDSGLDKDYLPEAGQSNPFLHMGLHISIREQLSVDQPVGITSVYEKLMHKHNDAHTVEHMMMECLAEMIWDAQRNNTLPDESNYLACLKKL
jgi:hypothetical protein